MAKWIRLDYCLLSTLGGVCCGKQYTCAVMLQLTQYYTQIY